LLEKSLQKDSQNFPLVLIFYLSSLVCALEPGGSLEYNTV